MTFGGHAPGDPSWQTKPTDRFVLRWIKVNLSARITPHLARREWVRPWMVTLLAASLGSAAGIVFALGSGWTAAWIAALAQVLDGVDGQLARLTRREGKEGAFMDSVLDRYADGAMIIGITVYLGRLPGGPPDRWLILLGSLALVGSNLISYSTCRAEGLGIALGPSTLASKGTRSAVMILCGWGTPFWPNVPVMGLLYLAFHTNAVVAYRLVGSARGHRRPPLP